MATHRRHNDWSDDSRGIHPIQGPVAAPQIVSGKITQSENMGPAPEPGGRSQGIPRAPRPDWSKADVETNVLPPRDYHLNLDGIQPRFYFDETVMLEQIARDTDALKRMNQQVSRMYQLGTQAGVYTDYLQIDSAHYIGQAAQLLIKARKLKAAYIEQHSHDTEEGA